MINSSGKLYCNHKDDICSDCLIRWNNRSFVARLTVFNSGWVGNAKMVETANTKGQTNIARKIANNYINSVKTPHFIYQLRRIFLNHHIDIMIARVIKLIPIYI
jgi:hypothetical protein